MADLNTPEAAAAHLDRLAAAVRRHGLRVEHVTIGSTGRPGLEVMHPRTPTRTATVVASHDMPGGWRYWWSDGEFIGMAGEVEFVARLVDKAVRVMNG